MGGSVAHNKTFYQQKKIFFFFGLFVIQNKQFFLVELRQPVFTIWRSLHAGLRAASVISRIAWGFV